MPDQPSSVARLTSFGEVPCPTIFVEPALMQIPQAGFDVCAWAQELTLSTLAELGLEDVMTEPGQLLHGLAHEIVGVSQTKVLRGADLQQRLNQLTQAMFDHAYYPASAPFNLMIETFDWKNLGDIGRSLDHAPQKVACGLSALYGHLGMAALCEKLGLDVSAWRDRLEQAKMYLAFELQFAVLDGMTLADQALLEKLFISQDLDEMQQLWLQIAENWTCDPSQRHTKPSERISHLRQIGLLGPDGNAWQMAHVVVKHLFDRALHDASLQVTDANQLAARARAFNQLLHLRVIATVGHFLVQGDVTEAKRIIAHGLPLADGRRAFIAASSNFLTQFFRGIENAEDPAVAAKQYGERLLETVRLNGLVSPALGNCGRLLLTTHITHNFWQASPWAVESMLDAAEVHDYSRLIAKFEFGSALQRAARQQLRKAQLSPKGWAADDIKARRLLSALVPVRSANELAARVDLLLDHDILQRKSFFELTVIIHEQALESILPTLKGADVGVTKLEIPHDVKNLPALQMIVRSGRGSALRMIVMSDEALQGQALDPESEWVKLGTQLSELDARGVVQAHVLPQESVSGQVNSLAFVDEFRWDTRYSALRRKPTKLLDMVERLPKEPCVHPQAQMRPFGGMMVKRTPDIDESADEPVRYLHAPLFETLCCPDCGAIDLGLRLSAQTPEILRQIKAYQQVMAAGFQQGPPPTIPARRAASAQWYEKYDRWDYSATWRCSLASELIEMGVDPQVVVDDERLLQTVQELSSQEIPQPAPRLSQTVEDPDYDLFEDGLML